MLEQFPIETIKAVTDPARGLPSKLKWLPTIAEIAEACKPQEISPHMAWAEEWDRRVAAQLAERHQLQIEHQAKCKTYDELKAKYGLNWGIGTSQEAPQVKKARAFKRYTDDEIRAMYRSSEGRNG